MVERDYLSCPYLKEAFEQYCTNFLTAQPEIWEPEWMYHTDYHQPRSDCECERCNRFFEKYPGLRDVLGLVEYIEEFKARRSR